MGRFALVVSHPSSKRRSMDGTPEVQLLAESAKPVGIDTKPASKQI